MSDKVLWLDTGNKNCLWLDNDNDKVLWLDTDDNYDRTTKKAEVKMEMTEQRKRELENEMVDAIMEALDTPDTGHPKADEILQKYLRELGHGGIADLFDKCEKWYS